MKSIFKNFSLAMLICMGVHAQIITSAFSNLQPINKENISRLEKLAEFGRGTINTVGWSPNGTQIAVGGSAGVWVYQADNLALPPIEFEQHDYINDVLYSNDGQILFVAGNDSLLRMLDTSTYRGIANYCFQGYDNGDTPSCSPIYHMGLSQNGKWLALTLNDHVVIWDIQAHEEIYRLFHDNVTYAEFALDDTSLVTASTGWSSSVRFWQLKDLSQTELNEHPVILETNLPFPIWDMQVSPDSRKVIVAGFSVTDSGVSTIDVESQKVISTATGAGNTASFISENIVASSSLTFNDGSKATYGAVFFDINTGDENYTIPIGSTAASDIALSSDGQHVAIGTLNGNLFVHDLNSKSTTTSSSGLGDYKWDVAFSEDGMSLAILTGNGIMARDLASGGADGGDQIYLWNLVTNTFQSATIGDNQFPQMNNISSIGDNDFIVTGYHNLWITQWSLEKGFEDLVSFSSDYSRVSNLNASFNNEVFVVGLNGMSKALGVVDLNVGQPQISYFGVTNDSPLQYDSVTFHPSGSAWAAADSNGYISIWEKGNSKARTFRPKYKSVTDIDFSDDGQWLAVNSFNGYGLDNLTLFDTGDFSSEIVLADENLDLEKVKFSVASDVLFTSSIDGDLVVWPVADDAKPFSFTSHSTNMRAITVNRQGTLIATCSFDGTVQVWGVRSAS